MIDLLRAPGLALTFQGVVEPSYVDLMGHMNVQWYSRAFDRAVWTRFVELGLDEAYYARARRGMFALEQSARYLAELREGEHFTIHTALVEARQKTLRLVHYMQHVEKQVLAATAEVVAAHVDLETRRTTPFPPELEARFAELVVTALPALPLTEGAAQAFARRWIEDWNRRDVEAVLAHYAEDAVFVSPRAERITGSPVVQGKAALRAYWQAALSQHQSLEFSLDAALWAPRTETLVVIYRASYNGQPANRRSEIMRFRGSGIVRGEAFHGGSALAVPAT
jgi:acyl-CoA thioester hydrolase